MSTEWIKQDDNTYYINLGTAFLVAVVYDSMGSPGWKVQVGRRALKDKLPTKEAAQKVALVMTDKMLDKCRAELDAFLAEMKTES